MRRKTYSGIDKDPKGAMNPTGNIIRDAWVFGLIPETQTCEGEAPTWKPLAAPRRSVQVELRLVGGHRFRFETSPASPLLRRLFAILAARVCGRDPLPEELIQIPLDDGRASCSFASSELAAVVTDPPVPIEGAPTPGRPEA